MNNKLISVLDLSAAEIQKIFQTTLLMKKTPAKFRNSLQGKMFGLIFEKPSTRTWVSFECGVFQLGGSAVYLGPADIKMGIREEVRDVARVLNRYLAGVILRTFSHETIMEFGEYFEKPIINGLSDFEHPCQALADYVTILEKFGNLKKPKVAFIGDGNNVLTSLILLAAQLGGRFSYATPKNYVPDSVVLQKAMTLAKKTGARIEGSYDPIEAVRGADVIYTDVWVSMGEEELRNKKMRDFKGFQINKQLVRKANPKALIMHCLPAHRGEEITDEMMDSSNSVVFDQAENRLHVQKAILLHLCAKKTR